MTECRTFCVTGGSGFLGRHLITLLAGNESNRIKYLSRRGQPLFSELTNVECCEGDLLDEKTLKAFVEKDACLINLAYLFNESSEKNLAVIGNLLSAARKRRISRFVHCSTAIVVGNVADEVIDENTRCRPQNKYERTKLQIEEMLLNKGGGDLQITILRPAAVFGKFGQNLNKLMRDLRNGQTVKNYIRKTLFRDRTLNLVSVENVVEALQFLTTTGKEVSGEIFLVADDDAKENNYAFVSQRIEEILKVNPWYFPVFPVSTKLLSFMLRVLGRSNTNIYRKYSSEKIQSWGWCKRHDFVDMLNRYIKWYSDQNLNGLLIKR